MFLQSDRAGAELGYRGHPDRQLHPPVSADSYGCFFSLLSRRLNHLGLKFIITASPGTGLAELDVFLASVYQAYADFALKVLFTSLLSLC